MTKWDHTNWDTAKFRQEHQERMDRIRKHYGIPSPPPDSMPHWDHNNYDPEKIHREHMERIEKLRREHLGEHWQQEHDERQREWDEREMDELKQLLSRVGPRKARRLVEEFLEEHGHSLDDGHDHSDLLGAIEQEGSEAKNTQEENIPLNV